MGDVYCWLHHTLLLVNYVALVCMAIKFVFLQSYCNEYFTLIIFHLERSIFPVTPCFKFPENFFIPFPRHRRYQIVTIRSSGLVNVIFTVKLLSSLIFNPKFTKNCKHERCFYKLKNIC
jgi:hypothetical protein